MSTFGEMIDRIADELDDIDLKSGGQIAKAINSAVQEYRDKKLWFLRVKAKSFSVAASEYCAPSISVTGISTTEPVTAIDQLRIDNGAGADYRTLIQVDDSVIENSQTGTITGRPSHFSLVSDATGTRIRFFPIPDIAYTALLTGSIRYEEFDDDSDENPWLTDGEELIRLAATRKIMSNITKELPHGAPPSPAEQLALSALYKTTRLRMGSPSVPTEVAGMQGGSFGVIADIRYG